MSVSQMPMASRPRYCWPPKSSISSTRRPSVREAGRLTGVPYTDFPRIRNVDLDRFTIDRLMKILGQFDRRVDVQVAVTPKTFEPA